MKNSLRLKFKTILASLPHNQIEDKSRSLSINLKTLIEELKSKNQLNLDPVLGGFSSIQYEPLWHLEIKKAVKLALPCIDKNKIIFCLVDDRSLLNQKMITLGSEYLKNIVIPDILIIPGLAFSLKGERLGRGGGFYDKYLSTFKGIKIAVCYEKQITDEIITEKHDEKIEYLVTEKEIYKIKD